MSGRRAVSTGNRWPAVGLVEADWGGAKWVGGDHTTLTRLKLPLLTERIKVKMLEQDIDYFYYGDISPYQPLYNKIDYLQKSSSEYKSQQRFDKKLADMLKGVAKAEWPNWPILLKVFDYWGVELNGDRFFGTKKPNS